MSIKGQSDPKRIADEMARPLSPEEQGIRRDLEKILNHRSYTDASHPLHEESVRCVRTLYVSIYGTPEEVRQVQAQGATIRETIRKMGWKGE